MAFFMDSKQPTFWTASKRRLFHKPDGSFDRLCLIFLRTSACHFSASRPTSLPGGTADHCGHGDTLSGRPAGQQFFRLLW